MRKRLYRSAVDSHIPHSDCLIERVALLVPDHLRPAWEKGIGWAPRINGWEHSFGQSLDCVKQGVRPLLYGWTNEQLLQSGLDIIDMGWIGVGFLPANRDLAELMVWGHDQDDVTHHVINGVVLGYPLAAVEHWIVCGCPGPTMREILQIDRL